MKNEEPSLVPKVHQLLQEDFVLVDLRSQTREEALQEMAQFIKAKSATLFDQDLYEKLLKRERLGSTAVGEGYAIPHCKIQGVESPLVGLAVSKKGISFDSADGKPSFVFFVVVTPADHPNLNLQVLAVVAHLIRRSRHLSKKLTRARTSREILDIIREEEEKFS
jgi:PTS system nitrogen regulatory IIA component